MIKTNKLLLLVAQDDITNGASFVLHQQFANKRRRDLLGLLLITIASTIWIGGLLATCHASDVRPWCCMFACLVLGCIFCIVKTLQQTAYVQILPGEQSRLSLVESLTITYFCLSLFFCSWTTFHWLFKIKEPPQPHQYIDIQLTDLKGFTDRHSLLSATVPKPSQRKKVSSDPFSKAGARTNQLSTSKASPTVPNQQSTSTTSKPHTEPKSNQQLHPSSSTTSTRTVSGTNSHPQPTLLVLLSNNSQSAKAVTIVQSTPKQILAEVPPNKVVAWGAFAPLVSPTHQHPANTEVMPELEEVKPEEQEMLELVNNDGEKGWESWQTAGRSSNGNGAPNDLTNYLKDLSTRLKTHWSPPQHRPHTARILFRIDKSGKLLKISILQSSSDPAADASAIDAITKSAPFKPLPATIPFRYLDVAYTFNYNLNELQEINEF